MKMGVLEIILRIVSLYSMFKMVALIKQDSPKFLNDVVDVLKDKDKFSTYPDRQQKDIKTFFAYFLVVFVCIFIIGFLG